MQQRELRHTNTNYVALATELGVQGFIQGQEFRAKCPLHNDSNPSFSMRIETGLWICHRGCGSGNFLYLVQLVLACTFGEAEEWIASNGSRVGVEKLSERLANALSSHLDNTPDPNLAYRTYFNTLSQNAMPMWFLQRGFTWDSIFSWNIRYDPVMGSVVLPVYWEGEWVGIISRHTRADKPKYENSDFKKSQILFGEISKDKNEIILCEGVLDALWLWQLGYNAASILGQSLSERQAEILRGFGFGVMVMALDNDEAGMEGTRNAVSLLTRKGWLLPQLSFVRFPGKKCEEGYKKDPNSCTEEEFKILYENRSSLFG